MNIKTLKREFNLSNAELSLFAEDLAIIITHNSMSLDIPYLTDMVYL
jgi:hypothetical protein